MIVRYIFNVLGPDPKIEIREAWVNPQRIAFVSHQTRTSVIGGQPCVTWDVFIDGQMFLFLEGPWMQAIRFPWTREHPNARPTNGNGKGLHRSRPRSAR